MITRRTRVSGLVLMMCVFLGTVEHRAAGDDLAAGFAAPPRSAWPWTYWFVMDGNLNCEGITADFEAMKRVGLGGVLFMEVDVGVPKGPVKFMSPQWRELFKHANQEAARLGLAMTMPASPGWTGSGGPWVKPEQSMQKLVWSETDITGPQRFEGTLPQPETVAGYYRDVAVLAFPAPAKPYQIEDIQEKTIQKRGWYSSQPGVKAMLPPAEEYPELSPEQVVPMDRIVDLTGRMDGNGRLVWEAPAGQWTVLRFSHTSTGATTRPAPEPGLGLECDKFDKAALEAHFDDFLGTLMSDIGPLTGKSLVSLHIDSWEMGPQNWTARFPDEFRQRRGYDLLSYLPVMTGRVVTSLEISERFLWDVRQTILELIAQNHAGHLAELAHRHGLGLSIEPYDQTPCDDMTYGARADVPMGEFWRDTFSTWFSCTEASSIAHTYGKQIVQAEAFTSGDGERWLAYPASLKALGDWAFCEGINRFVFHRYAHQPWLDRYPGMTMGPYGIHYERTQTWWDMSRAWIEYLSRCQFMLQQGLFVADVCFLKPEESPQVFRPPASATQGNPPSRLGYGFDGCTAEALLTRMSVKDGRLSLPDGMTYRVLVLPEMPTMTPALLGKIRELVSGGATIIGPRPLRSPSLSDFPRCDGEVRDLAEELWANCDGDTVREHACGKGRILWRRAHTEVPVEPTEEPLKQAQWIWHDEGSPAQSAPVGKRFFRRTWTLEHDATVESARVFLTADNAFELWINGRHVGAGNNFHQLYDFDVREWLQPGVNVVAVAAENGSDAPNPAGLIAELVVKSANRPTLKMSTDRTWQTAPTVQDSWPDEAMASGSWQPAVELGPLGMAPWGAVNKPATQPEFYCDFSEIIEVLGKMGVPPDFESEGSVRYIHRRIDETDVYFVANCEERVVEADCVFRVSGKTPQLWDPLTGERKALPEFVTKNGRTSVPMRFEPAQSFFVVFRKSAGEMRGRGRNFPPRERLMELTGPWEVSFDPKWSSPEKVVFQSLEDWSKRPEDGIRHYSGSATYSRTFDMPEAPSDQRLHLDLGDVRNLAQVRLNGRDLGVVWCAPWSVDVTGAVRAKDNRLEITVANLWPNRLIGDQSVPQEKRRTWTTWNPFKADTPLLESGLLGPVVLESILRP